MRHQRGSGGDQFGEPKGTKWRSAVGLLALGALAAGCAEGWIRESRLAPTGLGAQDAITVILAQPRGDEYSPGLEGKVAGCVRNALQQSHSEVRVVPPDEFRQVAFPGLSPEELPQDDPSWGRLVTDPTFLARIAPLGLRYLIAVSAREQTGKFDWDLIGGGTDAGMALDWSRDRSVSMEATVVDIMHRRVAGSVHGGAAGTSHSGVFLLFYLLPIPYSKPSFPVGTACWELGEGVAKFLAGESPPKP